MQKLKQLITMIDTDWVKSNPDTAYELIEALITEYYHMKDYIQAQRKQILLLKAIALDSNP